MQSRNTLINQVFSIGYNHVLLTPTMRKYIDIDQKLLNSKQILNSYNLQSFTFLNTCNRIEAYGEGNIQDALLLFKKVVKWSYGQAPLDIATKVGTEAICYIYRVAGGLDSKLIGDAEILGQFKQAVARAKRQKYLSGFMEKLINSCLQASKEIKSQTNISAGTISLAYAVVHILKQRQTSNQRKVVIIGAGEFAEVILKYLDSTLENLLITISNRNYEKAKSLINSYQTEYLPFEKIPTALKNYDVVISAINTDEVHYQNKKFETAKHCLVFDLSVPQLFAFKKLSIEKKNYFTIDQATQIVNNSFKTRMQSLPEAQKIIKKHIELFIEWSRVFEKKYEIHEWKNWISGKLNQCPHMSRLEDQKKQNLIDASTKEFALYLKEQVKNHINSKSVIQSYLSDKQQKCQDTCEFKQSICEKKCLIYEV